MEKGFVLDIKRYQENIPIYLSVEKSVKELIKGGLSYEEIIKRNPSIARVLEGVPSVLYHGSMNDFSRIGAFESTQRGAYVYATDNPMHALFFAIFRNSSVLRAHIREELIDGKYVDTYILDERLPKALESSITDRNIYIYKCDGSAFFKPEGESYISREWLSKDHQDIVPLKKYKVNVLEVFKFLESQGKLRCSRYYKGKDWKTVMDFLGQNYAYGMGTAKANDEEFLYRMDNFLKDNFPDQYDFSIKFRKYVLDYLNTPSELSYNDKLCHIKNYAESFLRKKRVGDRIYYSIDPDMEKDFMGSFKKPLS